MALRIWFSDFWGGFTYSNNYFFHLLHRNLDIRLTPDNPDLLIFSGFGTEHERYRCRKIHYTGESATADQGTYDLSFGFQDGPKEYRLPLWSLYLNWFDLPYPCGNPAYLIPLDEQKWSVKERFCNFVYSHDSGLRMAFLSKVSQYKQVDCAGRLANNVPWLGGDEKDKLDFLSRYKFTIAFENKISPGYVTEKILHPLAVGSIPIYWGSEAVLTDFNPKRFIFVRDLDEALRHVVNINGDDELFKSYLSAPMFENGVPDRCRPEAVLAKIKEVL